MAGKMLKWPVKWNRVARRRGGRHIARVKVLIDSPTPVLLAHGGAQIQIEQTKAGLEALGVEVEFLRWWDKDQRGDLIHYFGTASNSYQALAQSVGLPVVMTNLFAEPCNRSKSRLRWQGRLIEVVLGIPVGRQVKNQLIWSTYRNATHNIVGLECEKFVLENAFLVPPERVSLVPLGLSENYLKAGSGHRDTGHLICTGTITRRKNSVELARLARAAGVPIRFVGRPYHPADDYWRQFQSLVDGQFVQHAPHTDSELEMVRHLQSARGFVLMSQFENWCLSAHEAVACGLPVLVQDQTWSRERFGNQAHYFETIGFSEENVRRLKRFYAEAPGLAAPTIKLDSWTEVAAQIKTIYEKVLAG